MNELSSILMILSTLAYASLADGDNFTGIGQQHPVLLIIYTAILSLFLYKKTSHLGYPKLRKFIALCMITSTFIPYGRNIHLNFLHVLFASSGTALFLGLLFKYYMYHPLFRLIVFTTVVLLLFLGHISLAVETFLVVSIIILISS